MLLTLECSSFCERFRFSWKKHMVGYGIFFNSVFHLFGLFWAHNLFISVTFFWSSNYNLPKCCFPHPSCSLSLGLEVWQQIDVMYIYRGSWKMAYIFRFFESYPNIIYSPRHHYQTVFSFWKIESLYVRFENKNLFGDSCFYQNALFLLPILREADN